MRYKTLYFTLFLLGSFINNTLSQCTNYNGYPENMFKYWQVRENFDKYFIHTDMDENGNLTGDGIGTWDADKMRYTKAGFSIPASSLVLTDKAHESTALFDLQKGFCNNAATPGKRNYLTVGQEMIAWGNYVAMLSTEYELLRRSGQETTKIINEIFLALQAYRRVDMTANRLAGLSCECKGGINRPNLTGYSGFIMRGDAPSDFHQYFDYEDSTPDWEIGGIRSNLTCNEDILPCSFREINDLVMSKDEVIGVIYGLVYLDKFITATINVTYDGRNYNLKSMSREIVNGLFSRIAGSFNKVIRFPACFSPSGHVIHQSKTGENGSAFKESYFAFYHIFRNMGGANKLFWIPGTIDYLAWQANITLVSQNLQKPVNERITLKMATLADLNYPGSLSDLAGARGNSLAHLSWALLHDKNRDEYESWLPEMLELLCLMSCEGPCKKVYQINEETGEFLLDEEGNMMPANPNWPDFVCNNSLDNPHPEGEGVFGGYNPWCNQDLWESVGQLAERCKLNRLSASKGPGVDYMLAYNVYHLLNEGRPFFDPFSGEYNSLSTGGNDQAGFNGDDIEGNEFLCEDVSEFRLKDDIIYEDVTWEISDNLAFVNSSSNDDIIAVSPASTPNSNEGRGYIRATTETDECNYLVYEKPVWWGRVLPTLSHEIEICPSFGSITVESNYPEGTTFEWAKISGINFLGSSGASVSFYLDPNLPSPVIVGFKLKVIYINCEETESIHYLDINTGACEFFTMSVYPNPTSGIVTIELSEEFQTTSESITPDVTIIKSTSSEIVYASTFNSSSEKKIIETSNWTEGVYQIILSNGSENIFVENLIVNKGE